MPLYVLRKISTDEILKRSVVLAEYPVEGLDSDLEYLPMVEDSIPDFDPRYFTINKIEGRQSTPLAWRITWQIVKRATPEIKRSVKNVERLEHQKHVTVEERDKLVLLGLTVLFRKINNLELTAKEQALADLIVTKGTKIWRNDDRAQTLQTLIEAGSEPDLDTGWEPV